MMRLTGDLGLTPISLINMGHDGYCGDLGDTGYYLNSKLKQNIAYAAYDQPKTITEIKVRLIFCISKKVCQTRHTCLRS